MIYLLKERASPEQVKEMLQTLSTYIKLAVDIERNILVGGGVLHADAKRFCWKTEVCRKIFGARIGFQTRKRSPLNR